MQMREKFGTLATSIGLLRGSLASVSQQYLDWQRPNWAKYGHSVTTSTHRNDIEVALSAMFPLTLPLVRRYLLCELTAGWTAYFDNGARGPDPSGPVPILAMRLGTTGIRATTIPHTVDRVADGCYGANIFEMFDETGAVLRSVYCANDGGKWRFGQSGPALRAEDQAEYSVKRVRDRFTEESLRRLLKSVAVDPFDLKEYTGVACLISKDVGDITSEVSVSLESARRHPC